ncbi:MAG: hypothetical protein QM770_06030 [Tepidisphaeraceae bacterium]
MQGIGLDGKAVVTAAGSQPTTFSIKGNADIVPDDNTRAVGVDLAKNTIKLDASYDRIDASLLNAIVAATGAEQVSISGNSRGTIAIDLKPGQPGSVIGTLDLADVTATAPPLKGDTFTLKSAKLSINADVTAGNNATITVRNTGLTSDLLTIDIAGSAPIAALSNAAKKQVPGGDGSFKITTRVPSFAALATMLPHTLRMQEGVTVTGGSLASDSTITLSHDAIDAKQTLLADITGTRDGKPIRIEPMSLDAGVAVAPDGKTLALRTLQLNLKAPFANLAGGGTPGDLQLAGMADLTRAREQIAQFVDLGDMQLAGLLKLNSLTVKGKPTDPASPTAITTDATIEKLTFANKGKSYLANEDLKVNADAVVSKEGDTTRIVVNALQAAAPSGLIDVKKTGDGPATILVRGNAVGGTAQFRASGDLARLGALAGLTLERGVFDSTLTLESFPDKQLHHFALKGALSKLTAGQNLQNEAVTFGLESYVPTDLKTSTAWFDAVSSFASIKATDVKLNLLTPDGKPAGAFELLQNAAFTGDISSMPKFWALIDGLLPAKEPAPAQRRCRRWCSRPAAPRSTAA